MNTAGPERLLAVVLSRLSGQARGRLVEGLPAPCREGVLGSLDEIDRLDRSEMTVVEQVLVLELERLFGDVTVAQDTFREYYSLRVADIITLVLLKGNAEHAASTDDKIALLRRASALRAEKLRDAVGAVELLERARDASPEDRDLLLEVCDAYSSAGRADDAIHALEQKRAEHLLRLLEVVVL